MTTYEPPRPWIASYAEGVPEDLEPVTGSLVDIVEASARDFPEAPALQFFGRTTSYRQLHEAIERAAAGLRDQGVSAGDPVAIAAYIGKGRAFDEAMDEFANTYADQTERDHRQLVDALASGLLPSAPGW